jgi:hypothetical protein
MEAMAMKSFPDKLSNREMRIFMMEIQLGTTDYEVREKIRILSNYVLWDPWKCRTGIAFIGEEECVVYRKLWWGLRGWEKHMIVKDEVMLRILHRESDYRLISEDELGTQYKRPGRTEYWTRPHRPQYEMYRKEGFLIAQERYRQRASSNKYTWKYDVTLQE